MHEAEPPASRGAGDSTVSQREPDSSTSARPFRTLRGKSVLQSLEDLGASAASIYMRKAEDTPSPVTVRRDEAGRAEDDSHYQILGEIARGGIGIVYRGRDKDLNRDIAIKVLRRDYAQRPDVVQRFVEEAQVGGQLQHPGIVPIYGLSLQGDGRPSFAMKLIKGKTLAELLESNPRGIDLIAVFEQIAETMAYAHSRRVIHRDLKPANVMVGAYGEVQVVDWGFAKVLGQQEVNLPPDRSIIATVRSGGDGSDSLAGSVMGTLAYMPPEQAMGSIEDLDERCDVFSLGAILCEILTGKAPYTGAPKDQLIAATQCRLEPAFERLDAADAPDGLKDVVRACLQALTADRPKNARVVAEQLSSYLASVQERARKAEVDALASETRAEQERKARRRAVFLAGVLGVAILAGGGGYLMWKRERDARHARAVPLVASALREAIQHEGDEDWLAAAASAQRAVDIAASEGVDDAGARSMLTRYEENREAAEREARIRAEDDALLADLVAIRNLAPGSMVIPTDGDRGTVAAADPRVWKRPADRYLAMDAAYVATFEKRFGSVEASLDRLRASRHAADFAANLGYWCFLRKGVEALAGKDWTMLDHLARQVDPGNEDIHDALLLEDVDALMTAVEKRGDMLPLALVSQVATTLIELGRPEDAIAFLLPWNRRHPDEMMIFIRIAEAARQIGVEGDEPAQLELAIRHATAAVALRPQVDLGWFHLGLCLASAGELDRAIAAFRKVLALTPGHVEACDQLADALLLSRRPEDALAVVDQALELTPEDIGLLMRRGAILSDHMGRHEEAIQVFRRVATLRPSAWAARTSLALAQARMGHAVAAQSSLEEALALAPDSGDALAEVARGYLELGQLEESVRYGRKAVALDRSRYGAHVNLGTALEWQGESEAAVAAYREAIEVAPRNVAAYVKLVDLYLRRGETRQALACANESVEASSRSAAARAALAAALLRDGSSEEARAQAERAIQLDPRAALGHARLGAALLALDEVQDAQEACERAVALDPDLADAHRTLAMVHARQGERDAALAAYERAVALQPEHLLNALGDLMGRAQLYDTLHDPAAALAEYEKAAHLDHNSFQAHLQVGRLRIVTEDAEGAVTALRRAVDLDGESAWAHALLGLAYRKQDDVDAALASLSRALELGSPHPGVPVLYGELLLLKGRVDEALEVLEGSIESNSGNPQAHYLLGRAYLQVGEVEDAARAYRTSLDLDPRRAPAFHGLGLALEEMGRSRESLAVHRKAAQLAPDDVVARAALGVQLARVGELDDALRELSVAAEADAQYEDVLAQVQELVDLAPRLRAVVDGKDRPKTAREALGFARLAQIEGEFEAAVPLFDKAFAKDQSLGEDLQGRRYLQAVFAAVQAGESHYGDALGWMKAWLELCKQHLETDRTFLRRSLPPLKVHLALAPVRDVGDVPEGWAACWADLDALIQRTREAE